jgi:hypothetical protein
MNLIEHWYHPIININLIDIILIFALLFILIIYANYIQNKNIDNPAYKVFKKALIIKFITSILFALIVFFFYPGDSMVYFQNLNCFNKLFFINPNQYFDILLEGNKIEFWSYFSHQTGYPAHYMWRDPNSIFVSRFFSPFMFLTYNSYFLSTIIAGLIGFSGIWKLYITFCHIYPGIENKLAFAIIFFPSSNFWSSGIMKDTLTLSAIGWLIYGFYFFFITKKIKIKYILFIIFSSIIIINIKSYILLALIPGVFVWLFFNQIKKIKSRAFKILFAPILIILITVIASFLLSSFSDSMGPYGSIDESLKQAQIIQEDLTRSEQYGENYYDIGKFDATPLGALSKAPIAIISGIFRPFIWEARNPFVILSGLESLFMLGLLFYTIKKLGFVKFIQNISASPILVFSFLYVIVFGFGVGLASANFGALVRYKIPLLPFYISGLFILTNMITKKDEVKGIKIK